MKTTPLVLALSVVGVAIFATLRFIGGSRAEATDPRLAHFELEIRRSAAAPTCRVRVVPGQPVRIAPEERDGEPGVVLILDRAGTPEAYDRTLEEVRALVRSSGVLDLPQTDPERSFTDAAPAIPSLHVRIAWANGARWASACDLADVPDRVARLADELAALARRVMRDLNARTLDPDRVVDDFPLDLSKPVLEIEVRGAGTSWVDGREVSHVELESLQDELARDGGGVRCFLEMSAEQSEPRAEAVQRLLDETDSRELLVRLRTDAKR